MSQYLNAIINFASLTKKSPSMNNPQNNSELEPLEQAQEIQNEGNRRRPRENHRRPTPIARPFEFNRKRRRKARAGREIPPRPRDTLCTSDGDTDFETDTKISTPAQPAPMKQTPNRPEKARIDRKGYENSQEIPSKRPSYPTTRMGPSNHSDQKLSDDESDVVILEKDHLPVTTCDRKSSKRKKRMEASGSRLDTNTPSTYDEVDRKSHNAKQEPPQKSLSIRNGEIKGQIPKKKVSLLGDMRVPALKTSKYSRKNKSKHYDDVDMVDDYGKNNGNNGDVQLAPPYIDHMKAVVEQCENDAGKDKVYRAESTSRTTTSSRMKTRQRQQVERLNGLKKINNNRRAKRAPSKIIVPGSSLNQSQWRSEKDQDAYHTPKRKTQDDDAMQWNPLTGKSHERSRGMMTRQRMQYGMRTQKTADDLESPIPKRRKRESPTTRQQKRMKKKKPETIDILSSDSEDDAIVVTEKEECDAIKFKLKRLAVDDKVYNRQDHRPIVTFHSNEKIVMEIAFSKSGSGDVEEKISFDVTDIEELSNWAPSDTDTKRYHDLDSFIWIRTNVTMQSMSKRKGRGSTKDKRLILEFEDDKHMSELVEIAADHIDTMSIPPDDLESAAEVLISDSKQKYKLRSKVKPHEIDDFISGRRSDEILLVYPFGEDINNLEAAAEGLKELSWIEPSEGGTQAPNGLENGTSDSESLPTCTSKESSKNTMVATQGGQRLHFIEIRVEDYERLDTKQWLNDSLVDMWMQWISRHIICKRTSNVHFFTSHFYTTLASDGVEGVKSWTAKKNIDIFDKKLIFIPINKTLHWSLCVVVNPGSIQTQSEDDEDSELPCVLFFDSLNMHQKTRVHRHVMNWLNSEWQRKNNPEEKPFNKQTFKIYDPQVPRQNNGSDCGVFVCRYAFAMFQLRDRKFSRRDATLGEPNDNERKSRKKTRSHRSQAFVELITNGKEFDFDVDDIQRIRLDFKTLIKQLHPLYQAVKEGKIKAEKEEKLARKRHRGKAAKSLEWRASTKNDTAETSSAPPASNLIDEQVRASIDSSDSSSKENCTPRGDGDESSPKMPKSNDVLEHPALYYNANDNETYNHQTPHALPTSVVESGEMADSDKIVHF
eukprot:CAMPEP_0116119764 /NCGR_PEP_ID=MMETSP0329-20121206/2819_1 /TAXON_ID=697910 /ORGANISM="Pseudo-nitzschia arenysensis, Strain B593" /LENGTH=1105 /DNA_ID=CAMNT_0003613495 /DNA_START=267 /DNA_END=3584 /DNA_ORIENTATION=+